jgi:hypothetical protein
VVDAETTGMAARDNSTIIMIVLRGLFFSAGTDAQTPFKKAGIVDRERAGKEDSGEQPPSQ